MSVGEASIKHILDTMLEQAAIPWYQPPDRIASYETDKKTGKLHFPPTPEEYRRWLDWMDWKKACNEIAVLTGEPLPYPPKMLPKGPALKLRHPSAFSFKDTATLLSTEIDQLRTSYATDQELEGLDMCLGGEDCCKYHTRMKELGRILPVGVTQLDTDMNRGKPFVPRVQKRVGAS